MNHGDRHGLCYIWKSNVYLRDLNKSLDIYFGTDVTFIN